MTEHEETITELIASKLRTGFIHPGDRGRGIPETPIVLPFATRAGQPKEMSDLMDGTVKLLAEAIMFTITGEGDTELVPRAEARTLRHAAGTGPGGPTMVPVHCRCDRKFTEPLAVLAVTDPARIVIDGKAIIRELGKREIACPHKRIER
jgi:hypothetical protein